MLSGIEWRCKAVKYSEKDLISDMSYFNFWLPIMKQNDIYEEYIPFYGILTGKESESASIQRKTI